MIFHNLVHATEGVLCPLWHLEVPLPLLHKRENGWFSLFLIVSYNVISLCTWQNIYPSEPTADCTRHSSLVRSAKHRTVIGLSLLQAIVIARTLSSSPSRKLGSAPLSSSLSTTFCIPRPAAIESLDSRNF